MILKIILISLSLLLATLLFRPYLIEESQVEFDVKAGEATETLKLFSVQSEINILFSESDLQGIQTRKVSGIMTPESALEKMLIDTGLIFNHDKESQAIAVYYPSRT